jgi:hypothetical protein
MVHGKSSSRNSAYTVYFLFVIGKNYIDGELTIAENIWPPGRLYEVSYKEVFDRISAVVELQ